MSEQEDPSRGETESLLWLVLPDDNDFKCFTYAELRDAHQHLKLNMNRKARTEHLMSLKTVPEIVAALRRYAPQETNEQLRALRALGRTP